MNTSTKTRTKVARPATNANVAYNDSDFGTNVELARRQNERARTISRRNARRLKANGYFI